MLFVCKYMGNYEAEAGKTFVHVSSMSKTRENEVNYSEKEKKLAIFKYKAVGNETKAFPLIYQKHLHPHHSIYQLLNFPKYFNIRSAVRAKFCEEWMKCKLKVAVCIHDPPFSKTNQLNHRVNGHSSKNYFQNSLAILNVATKWGLLFHSKNQTFLIKNQVDIWPQWWLISIERLLLALALSLLRTCIQGWSCIDAVVWDLLSFCK